MTLDDYRMVENGLIKNYIDHFFVDLNRLLQLWQ